MTNDDLKTIEFALSKAKHTLSKFTSGQIEATLKAGGDPLTAADTELDKVLRECLCGNNDGWLSEETTDDLTRLEKSRVWIVDPLDGTREFIQGINEWCVSIGLVEDGRAVASGIYNPARDQIFLGSENGGVTLNGKRVGVSTKGALDDANVLASRSEVKRGEWGRFEDAPFNIVSCGSVAYKLAQVSAGLADATFTLVPKNEWDVAAGTHLVEAGGGKVVDVRGKTVTFNGKDTLLPGLIACGPNLFGPLCEFLNVAVSEDN
ncbi:MAG: 3'(2'),5'-bisphosphate nucleotidase CysQ [Planctomycetota bacterium]